MILFQGYNWREIVIRIDTRSGIPQIYQKRKFRGKLMCLKRVNFFINVGVRFHKGLASISIREQSFSFSLFLLSLSFVFSLCLIVRAYMLQKLYRNGYTAGKIRVFSQYASCFSMFELLNVSLVPLFYSMYQKDIHSNII